MTSLYKYLERALQHAENDVTRRNIREAMQLAEDIETGSGHGVTEYGP